jgi:glucose-1-phosphate adenylyltransferase
MDVGQMVNYHVEKKADVTIAALPVPRAEARGFGIIKVDDAWRVQGFQEKPPRPSPMPGNPGFALASMGNYLFSTEVLDDILVGSSRRRGWMDFGQDVLPQLFKKMRVFVYDFNCNTIPGMKKGEQNSYWRDVGTIEAYYQTTMELKSVTPPLNLYNPHWPIMTSDLNAPPVKFVFNDEDRRGFAVDSVVSSGTIVSGGRVFDSVLGRNVFVHSWAEVRDSIIMDGVDIGRRCRIRRAIIDKNVRLPEGTVIGYDPEQDRARYTVSPTGIVIIPRTPRRLRLREMNR